jgi:hypothetical protein
VESSPLINVKKIKSPQVVIWMMLGVFGVLAGDASTWYRLSDLSQATKRCISRSSCILLTQGSCAHSSLSSVLLPTLCGFLKAFQCVPTTRESAMRDDVGINGHCPASTSNHTPRLFQRLSRKGHVADVHILFEEW